MMNREQDVLSALAKTVFGLNGLFVAIGEELARPAGLTAAWWLVLSTVLRSPRPVADIAREIGVTRQSVQRIADLLVERGLAEYQPNPAHRRAQLLAATSEGRATIRRIAPAHAAFARRLAAAYGLDGLESTLQTTARLSDALSAVLSTGEAVGGRCERVRRPHPCAAARRLVRRPGIGAVRGADRAGSRPRTGVGGTSDR